MTNYAGIDYGLGKSNIDIETGIRFGVISQGSINPDYLSDFESEYGDPHCPKCGEQVTDATAFEMEFPDVDTTEWEPNKGSSDYVCQSCQTWIESGDCFPDEAQGISYEREGYKITDCLQSDLFVLKSPFFTYAQFCSPCVPGAGNLDTPCPNGPKTYCLGHDWFDDDKAPYPVYNVTDGKEVFSSRIKCDSCQMLSIQGVPCHETGCPNSGSRWDAESQSWIKQRECRECGNTVDADDPCCNAPIEDDEV